MGMNRKEIDRKFDEIVDFAGVEKFIETPVKRYSSGMYVRLAFAVAAHLDPEILVVDEVLAVGDAEFQKKCLGKMSEVAQGGRTVLFVSHNMGAISRLCKKAVVFQQGILTKIGEANQCITSYLSDNNSTDKRIIDFVTQCSPEMDVFNIRVNDQQNSVIHLPADNSCISITVEGRLRNRLRMDIEARFYDYQGNPLGFFSPGHISGTVDWYDAGEFVITRDIHLPKITRGEYAMSIFLSDPTHAFWMEAPNAIQLIAQGTSTATGLVIDYAKGNGWVFLP
jgi:lipopolysaccharide transport system ATP-binding protein